MENYNLPFGNTVSANRMVEMHVRKLIGVSIRTPEERPGPPTVHRGLKVHGLLRLQGHTRQWKC